MKKISVCIFMVTIFLLASCYKTEVVKEGNAYYDDYTKMTQYLNLNESFQSYKVEMPNYLRQVGIIPRNISDEKATLGRVIFYDKNLSKDGTISCASCHQQHLAFSDDKAFSQGVENHQTRRNSLALGNVINFSAYYGPGLIQFFWDERAATVAEQSKASFENEHEMGIPMSKVVQKIGEHQEMYGWLFQEAFDNKTITEDKILDALTHFVNAMGSYQSKYDEGMVENGGHAAQSFPNYSDQENLGKALYLDHCSDCHSQIAGRPTIRMANNGLDLEYTDEGKGELTNVASDMGVFKVTSLRNIELTAPYMHDGRFATLEEVVEHYNSGVENHPNLHPKLKSFNTPRKLNLTAVEKAALVAFLKTLTDEHILQDEKFSNPFKE